MSTIPPGAPYVPARGEVWIVNFNPTLGHEQRGIRPAVVMSITSLNAGPMRMATVIPMTGTLRPIPIHVEVRPPEGNLRQVSYAMCDQIRSVSTAARFVERRGSLGPQSLGRIEDAIKIVLGL